MIMIKQRYTLLVRKLLDYAFAYNPKVAGVELKGSTLLLDLSFNSLASRDIGIVFSEKDFELYTVESPFLNGGMLAEDALIICLLERLTGLRCSGDSYYYEIELLGPYDYD